MNQRPFPFLALLAVIGVSIVFGMLIGGKLNAPRVVLASPQTAPIQLAPATSRTSCDRDSVSAKPPVVCHRHGLRRSSAGRLCRTS